MATPSASETRDLLVLAERMGIPVGEALRQVARVIADAEDRSVQATNVLSAAPVPDSETASPSFV